MRRKREGLDNPANRRDLAAFIARTYDRLSPAGKYHHEMFTLGVLMYLDGVEQETSLDPRLNELLADIADLCTARLANGAIVQVRSWKGAINTLGFETFEAWAERADRSFKLAAGATPQGEWTPWFCLFCDRQWVSGTEPDQCPDCDHHLMRTNAMTREQFEQVYGEPAPQPPKERRT